jgi:integrase
LNRHGSKLYAGLRRGELRALRVSDLDLATGVLRVARSWDDEEGEQEDGKSAAARRKVPVAAVLRDVLDEHLLATGRTGDDLVFGLTASAAFVPSTVRRRALDAWEGREPITPHEARHTFASLMIGANVNAKALSTYMGHASISITFDLYGDLMPGNEDQAAGLLDAFLARSASRDTGATMGPESVRSTAVESGPIPA